MRPQKGRIMKIKYSFCNEEVEIEVSDEWGAIILDLDREEYNSNQKETRRHYSLDAINLDDAYLPSDEDVEADLLEKEEHEQLHAAFMQLSPRQQRLIRQIFVERKKYSEMATSERVDESTIRHATDRALKKMKKMME